MRFRVPIVLVAFAISGCATAAKLPSTMGESASAYGYIPLDPLAVQVDGSSSGCRATAGATGENTATVRIMDALPDISVRFAVADVASSGSLSFGPAKVSVEGDTYKAVLDYVNVDPLPIDFFLRKYVRRRGSNDAVWLGLLSPPQEGDSILGFDARIPDAVKDPSARATEQQALRNEQFDPVTIPVYVGIGLRLTADIKALRGDVALSSLGTIGAAAQAEDLSGTLTVQTLGVTGQAVATALPLPSKLDQTTIESGILALGSVRSAIYNVNESERNLVRTPRIVGLYSPVGSNPALINAIYSELSRKRPPWVPQC